MARIFLSYAHEDQVIAKRIVASLAREGLQAWWDHEIPPGRTWDEMIGSRISAAHIVIVLWSERSIASNFVKEEAQLALDAGKLLPVKIEAVEPPIGFRRVHAANLANWKGESDHSQWRVVLGEIQRRLGDTPRPVVRQPATPSSIRTAAAIAAVLALIALGGFYAAGMRSQANIKRPTVSEWQPRRSAPPPPEATVEPERGSDDDDGNAAGGASAPDGAAREDVAQTVWQGPVFRSSGRASEWAVRFNADGTAAIDFLDGRGFIDTGDWVWTQEGRNVRLTHRPSGNSMQATLHDREMSGLLATPNSPRDSGTFRFTRR